MRNALIAVAVVLSIPLLIVLAILDTRRRNDRRLAHFSAQLFSYPLPPRSRVLSQTAQVGVLTGNGNHCDYISRMELESWLPIAAIEAHYKELQLRPAAGDGAGAGLPAVTVDSLDLQRVTVTATDAPYPAGLDDRCM